MDAPIAVFDLDGTLTRRDTSLPFLASVSGRGSVTRGVAEATVMGLPDLLRSVAHDGGEGSGGFHGFWGRWEGRLHERVVTRALQGLSRDRLQEAAEAFAHEIVDVYLLPGSRERLEHHRAKGHRTALASASLEIYVAVVAEQLGMDGAVGTLLEMSGDVATGRFEGAPCWGAEKLRRVKKLAEPWGTDIDYAYGNGRGDRELMAAARVAERVG